jgi:hypothetical protein
MKCYQIQKRGNFMMIMESRASKMEVLREVQASVVYLICLEVEERSSQDLEKENQN